MHVDQVWSGQLLGGVEGITQTLAAMAALVRRDSESLVVRSKALEIISHCPGHSFHCEIQALFEYCRNQIVYRRDPTGAEWVQDAPRTLALGIGDCDCKIVCLASMLASVGHEPRFKVIGPRYGKFKHVYLEVLTKDRGWMPLDPTPEEAPMGWEARNYPNAATYEIFNSKDISLPLLAGLVVLAYFLMR